MNRNIYEQIEKMLSELIHVMPEEEYTDFIENNELLSIYDKVAELKEPEKVLTDEVLNKILELTKEKRNSYR